jgi:hypothetical protein
MRLSGWIGPKKGPRERHVFTLQAMELCRLNPKKQNRYPACAGPRILAFATTPGKIYRKYLRSL